MEVIRAVMSSDLERSDRLSVVGSEAGSSVLEPIKELDRRSTDRKSSSVDASWFSEVKARIPYPRAMLQKLAEPMIACPEDLIISSRLDTDHNVTRLAHPSVETTATTSLSI